MKSSLLTAGSALLLIVCFTGHVSSSPAALKRLPSITMDTVNDKPFDPDAAESIPVPFPVPVISPLTMYSAYKTMGRVRNFFRGEPTQSESQGLRYYVLSPFRMAKTVGTEVLSMAKTFADTFQDQLQQQYAAMSHQVQEKMLPQAANYIGVWKNPQTEDEKWMEGI